MFDTLFCNADIITMQHDAPCILNGYAGVSNGFITYVGDSKPVEAAKRTIDCKGKILLPGLVNSHAHTPMSLMRGYADDYDLQEWLFKKIFPVEARLNEQAVMLGARLSYAELIACGVTSVTDMYYFTPAIAKVALECGIRTNICNALLCFDNDNFDFNSQRSTVETREMLKEFHNAGNGRIKVDAGIHAEYTSTPKMWQAELELAHEYDLNMHIHLSETQTEHQQCIERYGKTPARMFYENGIFDRPTNAAHCVWVSDEDLHLMAEKGVTAVHNPVSNLKLASGIARVAELQKRGVNVALGTDGCASNNTHDMFEELKFAALLQKGTLLKPTVLPACEALKLATVNGSKAQRREGQIGRIQPGYEADIILIDTNRPHMQPLFDPIGAVVYCARGSDVCFTMVQGRVLYENGTYTTLDIDNIFSELNRYGVPLVINGAEIQ